MSDWSYWGSVSWLSGGGAMGSLGLAAVVFAIVLVGGAIGLELQRRLPESYTTGGPRDMTGAVVGLMTLLLALVLGLLIWTAYGVYSTQKASVQTLAITDLKLDEAFPGITGQRRRSAAHNGTGCRCRSGSCGSCTAPLRSGPSGRLKLCAGSRSPPVATGRPLVRSMATNKFGYVARPDLGLEPLPPLSGLDIRQPPDPAPLHTAVQ